VDNIDVAGFAKGSVVYGPLIALVNTHFGHMGVMHKPSLKTHINYSIL
jgi:hypothetical protein